jgi:hypothetical protein
MPRQSFPIHYQAPVTNHTCWAAHELTSTYENLDVFRAHVADAAGISLETVATSDDPLRAFLTFHPSERGKWSVEKTKAIAGRLREVAGRLKNQTKEDVLFFVGAMEESVLAGEPFKYF